MNILLIVGALIIFTCIFLNKVSSRLGIPVLLLFILLGVLLGWHDEVSIETTKRAGDICTVALIFIMFYGGFGTNWKAAKPVADIREHPLSKNSAWIGKRIKDYPNNDGSHVVMIRRGSEQIIPDGNTMLCAGDILYLLNSDSLDKRNQM